MDSRPLRRTLVAFDQTCSPPARGTTWSALYVAQWWMIALLSFFSTRTGGSGGAHAEDWPQWRGPRADSTWNAPHLAPTWPAAGLRVVWKAPVGPGYSGIAVAGGHVFTLDKPATPADHERIVCWDAEDGRQKWEFAYRAPYGKLDYGKGPRCTPTVFDGRVYTLGAMGHVHCLDAATGRPLWQQDLMRDFKARIPEWGFAACPVIHGDKVIIHASVDKGAYLAFDRRTGKELWRGGEASTGYGSPLVIQHAGSEQLVGWTPEHVLGLSLDDGHELWRIAYPVTYGVSIATPIFHEQTVVVCGYWEGSKAIRLGNAASSVKLLWEENRFLRGVMSPPLYRHGYGYLLDKQHGLVCFKLSSGEKVWTDGHRVTRRDRNPQASLVWIGNTDRVLCLNAEGELILARLAPEGYEELARQPLVGTTWAHPAFAGNRVFARDDQQVVCAALPLADD